MSPALAVLIGELIAAGVDVLTIMRTANAQGRVPPAVWDEIRAEIERANARWEAAGHD